jgi:tetratricopeptide (TPR) repeat protein
MHIIGKGKNLSDILKNASELERQGNVSGAIKEVKKAIDVNPKDGNLYNRLGDLYIKSNNIKEAIEVYKRGVTTFRQEKFSRNALALCRKILRYNPQDAEIDLVIADLFYGLDEKSEALIYLFSFIDKHRAKHDVEEVIHAVEKIKKLGVPSKETIKRITEIYTALSREDLANEFMVSLKKEEKAAEEKPVTSQKPAPPREPPPPPEPKEIEEKKLKEDMIRLDGTIKAVETALVDLRKAIRLDEVISALNTSLITLSDEHKKSIALLQKSLNLSLDKLHNSIENLKEHSRENVNELKPLFTDLGKTVDDLNKNQASFVKKMDESLMRVGSNFSTITKEAFAEIKNMLSIYQKTIDVMCLKFDAARDSNISLLKVSGEIKTGIQGLSDSLTMFFSLQKIKDKKQNLYTYIIISIIAAICGLLVFLVLK